VGKVRRRLADPLISYQPLNFYGFMGAPTTVVTARRPLEIRIGSAADIPLMHEFLRETPDAAVHAPVEFLLAQGARPFLAFCEGRLAHIAWLHDLPSMPATFPLVELLPGEGWIGNCDTHPAFRGYGIYPVVLQHMLRSSAETGVRRCFISCAPSNQASIRGIEKAGFRFVSKKRKIRVLNRVFHNVWRSARSVPPDWAAER
jgi:hypothetical protein